MSSGKFKPKFSGDRAMLALQRQLADDPGLIPEPVVQSDPSNPSALDTAL